MMLGANTLAHYSTPERSQTVASDAIRRRALERLYERRATVDELIGALERYQQERHHAMAPCVDISVGRKCS